MADPLKTNPRVRMPATAKANEIVEVKTLITHEMENGQRHDPQGNLVPRRIINTFTVSFNGQQILSTDWGPSVAANPYQSFFVRVPETGTFLFNWRDDDGSLYIAESHVTVVG